MTHRRTQFLSLFRVDLVDDVPIHHGILLEIYKGLESGFFLAS